MKYFKIFCLIALAAMIGMVGCGSDKQDTAMGPPNSDQIMEMAGTLGDVGFADGDYINPVTLERYKVTNGELYRITVDGSAVKIASNELSRYSPGGGDDPGPGGAGLVIVPLSRYSLGGGDPPGGP